MAPESPQWLKLDNAAKLYPAIKTSRWSAVFRLAFELDEEVDPEILARAAELTVRRMPAFGVRMRRGLFWYYFEPNPKKPIIHKDVLYPCTHIDPRSNNGYLFKIRYYQNRIALEVFHSLSDGSGAAVFLKTLTATYLNLKHNIKIPAEEGVLDVNAPYDPAELEDSYKKYANFSKLKSRAEEMAYQVSGTVEPMGVLNVITGQIPLDKLMAKAKEHNATLTEYLVAVYIYSIYKDHVLESEKRKRPIKISVPINMRRFYPSITTRNFSLFVNVGIDPAFGEYTFEEIIKQVHHFMRLEIDAKKLNAQMAKNVSSEKMFIVRVMPLFIKRIALGLVFKAVGESRFTGSLSNLGAIKLPAQMQKYVKGVGFVLGRSLVNRTACAVASLGNTLYVTFSRSIAEAKVERRFFTYLIKQGIPVKIQTNRPQG